MREVLVVKEYDVETEGVSVIGVASSVEEAEKMYKQYFGGDVIKEVSYDDIRECTLEYIKRFLVEGLTEPYLVDVILEWYQVDSL